LPVACKGQRKLKILKHSRAFFRQWRQEMNEAAGKVVLREASRPAITYPDNLPVSQKKQAILEAVRDNQVVIVAGKPAPGKPRSYQKSVWNWGVG
jgi:ATP-dependent helicase HrpA